jgi:hypothetical protein
MLELLLAGCQIDDEMQEIEHIEHRHQALEQCDISNQKSAKTLHIAVGRPGNPDRSHRWQTTGRQRCGQSLTPLDR